MNFTKLWVSTARVLWKIIWQEDKIDEWLLESFVDNIKWLKWDELFFAIKKHLSLDFLSFDNKKECLDYLFQNNYIDSDNVEEFIKLFTDFKDIINNIKGFLPQWQTTLTTIWVWNDVRILLSDSIC